MGYIFDYNDSVACEARYTSSEYQPVKNHLGKLLLKHLKPRAYDSILDIGCGTGEMLSFLTEQKGLTLTGIDPSPFMLDMARVKLGNQVDLHLGKHEDLPFDDNSFNHACLMTSLEFSDNPEKAIAEAARIAKDRLFIGAVNRYSLKGGRKAASDVLEKSVLDKARIFSPWELKAMVRSICGDVPVTWCTVNLQSPERSLISWLGRLPVICHLPFGSYICMTVTLVPSYRVRPLTLKYVDKGAAPSIASGHCTTVKQKTVMREQRNHG